MVDALIEAWRVLDVGATLVDVRPMARELVIEVVDGAQATPVGRVDGSPGAPHDRAVERALAEVVAQGWFTPREQVELWFEHTWDSVDEMSEHLHDGWTGRHVPPDRASLEQAHRVWSDAGGAARVRICERVTMGAYTAAPRARSRS